MSWIDRHSVTCLICGGLADERETIKVSTDLEELPIENPHICEKITVLADMYGSGEAHQTCFDNFTLES